GLPAEGLPAAAEGRGRPVSPADLAALLAGALAEPGARPILADALEEAGRPAEAALLRGGGPGGPGGGQGVPALGAVLRERRRRAGLTQLALAWLVGVATSSVRRWERGDCRLALEHAVRLADALDLSAEEAAGLVEAGRGNKGK